MSDVSTSYQQMWAARRAKYGPSGMSSPYKWSNRTKRVKAAVGHRRKIAPFSESRVVNITFEGDTFEEIRARAVRNRSSFAEEVRTLVQWGLDSEGEA